MYWQSGQITEVIGFEWFESFGNSPYNVAFAVIMTWFLMFPLSLFSGKLFSLVWDDIVDLRGFYRKQRMTNHDKKELFKLIAELKQELSN